MAKYDPDRMSFDDIDWRDQEQVLGWLQHPNTTRTNEDKRRIYGLLPKDEKIVKLQESLKDVIYEIDSFDDSLPGPKKEFWIKMHDKLLKMIEELRDS